MRPLKFKLFFFAFFFFFFLFLIVFFSFFFSCSSLGCSTFDFFALNCCTISGNVSDLKNLLLFLSHLEGLFSFFFLSLFFFQKKRVCPNCLRGRRAALRASRSVATPTNKSFRVCKVNLAPLKVAIIEAIAFRQLLRVIFCNVSAESTHSFPTRRRSTDCMQQTAGKKRRRRTHQL